MKQLKAAWQKWFKEHFDYEIVGDYYDTTDGVHFVHKYNKRYFWRKKEK